MPDATAKYYHDELINWNDTLEYYEEEATELEKKLFIIIQQDTIPNLALHAEQFLNHFTSLRSELHSLAIEMHQQEMDIRKDDELVEDSDITSQIIESQDTIRSKMKTLEQNFIETKYNCYKFLSEIHKQ